MSATSQATEIFTELIIFSTVGNFQIKMKEKIDICNPSVRVSANNPPSGCCFRCFTAETLLLNRDGDVKAAHSGGKGRPRKRKLLASPPRTPTGLPRLPRRQVTPRLPLGGLSGEVKRSARLQHKRVRYDEMVQGNHPFSDDSSVDSTPQLTPVKAPPLLPPLKLKLKRSVLQATRRQMHAMPAAAVSVIPRDDDVDSSVSSDHENKDITNVLRPVFAEEYEIKRLRLKSRRIRLTAKEKERMKRLKDRVRRLLMEHRKQLKQRRIIAAEKQKSAQMKSKKKLLETHLYTKKYNQEHCYAACPESFDKNKNGPVEAGGGEAMQEIVVQPEDIKVEEVVLVPDASGELGVVRHDVAPPDVNGNDVMQAKQEQVVVGDIIVSQGGFEQEPGAVGIEPAVKVKEEKPKSDAKARDPVVLEIVHRDATRSGRGRWQEGVLRLDLYRDRDAGCVTCALCRETLPVRRFLKHMHPHGRADELVEVTLPQRLELKSGNQATPEELRRWDQFEALRDEFSKPTEKPARGRARRSQESASVEELKVKEEAKDEIKIEPSEDSLVITPKVEEKKSPKVEEKKNRSPKTQIKDAGTPIRNGQVSGAKGRGREPKNGVKSGGVIIPPPASLAQLKPVTPSPPLSKFEMPPTVRAPDVSPQDTNVRQSGRVRKRKQLHPCESYVFSSGRNLTAEGVPESKRVKLDTTAEG